MYTGGIRVVDISGDLIGDLYKQGREIGYLLTGSPSGYIPNDTMVWGTQLYKGHVFYSDFKIYGSLNNFLSNLYEFKLICLFKNNFTTFSLNSSLLILPCPCLCSFSS